MNKKRIILIIVIAIVIVAAVVGVLVYRSQVGSLLGNLTTTGSTAELGTEKLNSSLQQARAAVIAGDTKTAQAQLDKAIGQTSSKDEKADLYREKANISLADGDSAAAIDAAQAATENNATIENYDLLGWTYESSGDKAKAIEAYQNAIDEYKANPPAEEGQVTAAYYELKIKELKG